MLAFPSPARAFLFPLLFSVPGLAVVAVAVLLNWGR